ncbi:hypothetical protein [Aestuariibacter sp. A3R04]|uniref:hypothetical protein n=1 Tax=Aestuariibacter sp. A3R04 TaxID=2841571 RepID=UPI001C08618A|nr:hypothetical protein [Aestuariibacter sp. A3R04]MBU3023517.1 hypothetical protein [Aestuariibacter sp. A3R04]
MSNESKPLRRLGPVAGATLLTNNLSKVVLAYQQTLGFTLVQQDVVSQELSALWQAPSLLGHPMCVLQSANGHSWLRVVEDPNCTAPEPLKTHGWMSLESSVGDVDKLRLAFTNDCQFHIIGEPAYLQVSDAIKAMQVVGPAGEVAYLTQVERPVPPFELPISHATTGSLFIPVLSTHSRAASVAFYEKLNNADKALCFNTKVSVLNNAWGLDTNHQFPVATLQLDGRCLFEIDELQQAKPVVNNAGSLPSGIALITVQTKKIDALACEFGAKIHTVKDNYYPSNRVILLTGPSGERIELVG